MATLLLGVASSGLATATGVTAAAAGGSIGASFVQAGIGAVSVILGSYIDNLLFGGIRDRTHEGPRLTELKITGSTEGAPILEVFGNVRVAGQLIWATRHNQIETPDLPIKIKYTISLAIAICKGPATLTFPNTSRIGAPSVEPVIFNSVSHCGFEMGRGYGF
jgi:hypothetical protein